MDHSTMDYRTLKINKICARGVKDITFFSKLMVYAVVSISGDPFNPQTKRTNVDRVGLRNPTWNCCLKFNVMESLAIQDRLSLKIQLVAQLFSRDTIIDTVHIPLKVFLDNPGYHLSCQVYNKKSKKSSGTLNFSYEFGGRVEAPPPPKPKLGPFHSFEDAYMYCVKDIGMPYGPYAVRYGA
jgi:hypothetical protein